MGIGRGAHCRRYGCDLRWAPRFRGPMGPETG